MSCPHALLRAQGGGVCPLCPTTAIKRRGRPPGSPKVIKAKVNPWRADGWQNVVTGVGTALDKRTGGTVTLDIVPDIEARDLWRASDLAKRIIEELPKDALREGIQIKMDDKEIAEDVIAFLADLPGPSIVGKGAIASWTRARQFERAYGGAAIFPVINDAAGSLDVPLDENNIQSIVRLQVFEARQLQPLSYYQDPEHPKFGEPEVYQVMPLTSHGGESYATIHETRLIIYPGIRVSAEDLAGCRMGWGDNVLTPVRSVLNDFELSFGGAAHLLQDFAQGVIKLDGLAEIVAMDGTGSASKRLELMNWARSMLKAIVMDSKDSFERVTTNLTGLPEMIDRFMFRLAAAANMPVTKLMGMSPAGMNATGESDTRGWYDTVSSDQTYQLPMIERLVQLVLLSKDGPAGGIEPDNWSVEFPPLWQPSETETANARKAQAETDAIYLDRGVLSPEEVARARFGGDCYSYETVIDFDNREEMTPVAPEPAPTEAPPTEAPPTDPEPVDPNAAE